MAADITVPRYLPPSLPHLTQLTPLAPLQPSPMDTRLPILLFTCSERQFENIQNGLKLRENQKQITIMEKELEKKKKIKISQGIRLYNQGALTQPYSGTLIFILQM